MTPDQQATIDEVVHRLSNMRDTAEEAYEEKVRLSPLYVYGALKDIIEVLTRM